MKNICIFAVISPFLLFLCALSGLSGELLPKEQIDAISNTMSKTADVYYSSKSSAIETQKLLSGTTTQQTKRTQETLQTQKTQETRETQKTAKRSKILEILKKIEAAFLDASLNSNNHK